MKKYDVGMKINLNEKDVYVISATNYDSVYKEVLYNLIDIDSGIRYYENPLTLRELNERLDKVVKVDILKESTDISKLKTSIDLQIEMEAYRECEMRKIKGEKIDSDIVLLAHRFVQRCYESETTIR